MDKEEMMEIHKMLKEMNNDPNPLTYPNQPERSKREDLTSISEPSEECKKAMVELFWR